MVVRRRGGVIIWCYEFIKPFVCMEKFCLKAIAGFLQYVQILAIKVKAQYGIAFRIDFPLFKTTSACYSRLGFQESGAN